MNITKKILVASFVIFALPSTIAAASVNVDTAEKLNDAVKVSGNEVVLTADITADVIVDAETTITLDLNGYTLTSEASHTIVNSGILTIKDSSAEKDGTVDAIIHGKAAINNINNGKVTLDGGIFTRSKEAGTSASDPEKNTYYTVMNTKGEMTINDGVKVYQNGGLSSMIINSFGNYEGATMTINGGMFEGGANTVKNDENGTLTINNGQFINSTQATVLNWHIATINGGNYESADRIFVNGSYNEKGVYNGKSEGNLTINNGTFTAKLMFDQFDKYSANTELTINGGTYNVTDILFTDEDYPNLNIKGGVFDNEKEDVTSIETNIETLASVNEDTKKLVETKLPKEGVLVGYFDIDVILKDGTAEFEMTELENKMKITIDLPATIEAVKEGFSRKYYVAREHNGVVELLDAKLVNGKIEFESDKFSTYAVTYVDSKVLVNPDTGINKGFYILFLVIGLLSVGTTLKLRKN